MRSYTATFSCVVLATFHTLLPALAGAATGLFATWRTFYSDQVGAGNRTRTAFFPTATAKVGMSDWPGFAIPQSAIKDTTGYAACVPGLCRRSYPKSKAWYSYWNLMGQFGADNPNAATITTTVRFRTTMSNPTDPPLGSGEPITPTTTFGGRYDFSRGGTIMITPGSNRFGGTMQFFYGPNQHYYQLYTSTANVSKAYGYGPPPVTSSHQSEVGEIVVGREMNRLRMTTWGLNRLVVGTTPGGGPQYYSIMAQYISTIVPFTTGMIAGYQPVGRTVTIHTVTGYDNRTPAGLNGVISLVRPRLVHIYRKPFDPNRPITRTGRSSMLSTWQISFQFLPEPDGVTMMATGLLGLAGLYGLRKRRQYGGALRY